MKLLNHCATTASDGTPNILVAFWIGTEIDQTCLPHAYDHLEEGRRPSGQSGLPPVGWEINSNVSNIYPQATGIRYLIIG